MLLDSIDGWFAPRCFGVNYLTNYTTISLQDVPTYSRGHEEFQKVKRRWKTNRTGPNHRRIITDRQPSKEVVFAYRCSRPLGFLGLRWGPNPKLPTLNRRYDLDLKEERSHMALAAGACRSFLFFQQSTNMRNAEVEIALLC
jgi:hypothetical protein